jgi:hypothetical protein
MVTSQRSIRAASSTPAALRFIDGKPVDEAQYQTCFACHQPNVKDHDSVITRFAPLIRSTGEFTPSQVQ